MTYGRRAAEYGTTPELAAALDAGELSIAVAAELANFPMHVQRRAIEDRSFARETLCWVREEKRALRRFVALIRFGSKPSRTTKPISSASPSGGVQHEQRPITATASDRHRHEPRDAASQSGMQLRRCRALSASVRTGNSSFCNNSCGRCWPQIRHSRHV
jgi:hypothetical protein